jgi:hypothetical protein
MFVRTSNEHKKDQNGGEEQKSPRDEESVPHVSLHLIFLQSGRKEISRERKDESARDLHKVIRKSFPKSQSNLACQDPKFWLRHAYVADIRPQIER